MKFWRRRILVKRIALGLAVAAVAAPLAQAAPDEQGTGRTGNAPVAFHGRGVPSSFLLGRDPAKAMSTPVVAPRGGPFGTGEDDGMSASEVGMLLGILAGLAALGVGMSRISGRRHRLVPGH